MENKTNIAELLKDCPQGMELDCAMYDNITFVSVDEEKGRLFPIKILTKEGNYITLTKYGQYADADFAKCVIFPKGKTTWDGFQRPFVDGDILATDLGSVFFLNTRLNSDEHYGCYVGIGGDGSFHICAPFAYKECCSLATEEEKEKLFDAIKANDYRWNAETKTLEELIKPKFKVGDNIVKRNCINNSWIVSSVSSEYYGLKLPNSSDSIGVLPVSDQDDYELIPNKFDINTLIPFESRVLVRHNRDSKWCGSFFSHIDEDFHSHCYKFVTTAGKSYSMCIPYNEDTKHLIGTPNDCDEYYKTWE